MVVEPWSSPAQMRAALALAEAILPSHAGFPAAARRTVAAALGVLGGEPGAARAKAVARLFQALDYAALPYAGRRFQALDAEARERLLERWEQDPVLARLLWFATFVLKAAHFDHPSVYEAAGCVYDKGGPPERARWVAQVMPAAQLDHDAELECDAVVVGSGAGGAVVAKELAERGHAVVILEEGEHHRRDSFRGSALEAKRRFYRDKAAVSTVGNVVVPVFMGRLVGGSTAINTATCFRTPDWVLDEWCTELGTDALSPERMRPHFERVERTIQVAPVKESMRGAAYEVISRGCKLLGWRHGPMQRNAPDCDAQASCDFGCPSGARLSMDLSYLPSALSRSAVLVTGMRARRVLTEAGRAVGVAAEAVADGRSLRVRARVVVLAGGAVPTPLLLLGQGICNRSGQVGRNLSIHPAASLGAMFDEPIDPQISIPQTIFSDQFLREGILHNAASTPLSVTPLVIPRTGRRLMERVARFRHVANLGAMIRDEDRGRVRLGRDGAPLLTYWLSRPAVAKLHRGLVAAASIFAAAGARELYPMLSRFVVLDGERGVAKLRDMRLSAADLVLTSYHPLGTCRMGLEHAKSVVSLDHETHDVPGLFIVDGSTVPGPPGVNPQITILAMADRAAGIIAERLG